MPSRYEPKDLLPILREMEEQSDRAAITVAASLVGYGLERCLRANLRKPETAREKDILSSDFGILGSFGEQIWLAYFIKIIGPHTRHDLNMIQLIRNICAHDMNPISFDDDGISARVRSFYLTKKIFRERETPTLRTQYLRVANTIRSALEAKSIAHPGNRIRTLSFVRRLLD
jgi:hypothetical protein